MRTDRPDSHIPAYRLPFRLPRFVETFIIPQASLNFDDPTLEALLKALPQAPAMARRQCLKMCGLDDPEDGKDGDYSYDYDYAYRV